MVDADGQFIIDPAAFIRRRDSLAAAKRWQLVEEGHPAEKIQLPHTAAGAKPEVQERQERSGVPIARLQHAPPVDVESRVAGFLAGRCE